MFFAPPKVKSLSRYSEYGLYLGPKHFLIMLAIAFTAHMSIIAIYSIMPSEEVLKIPVRVLNIKLSGGSTANNIQMPKPAAMPEPQPVGKNVMMVRTETEKDEEDAPEPLPMESAETALDKEMAHNTNKKITLPKTRVSHAHPRPAIPPAKENTLATPKQYVRSTVQYLDAPSAAKGTGSGTGGGNGSGMAGEAGGREIIERYTQTISQYIRNHQLYARAAYGEAVSGQGRVAGNVVVRLRMQRNGHILYSAVERTSGNDVIDRAALAMVQASEPLPPVPGNYRSDNQLEFLIAVQVDLAKH